MSYIQAAIFCVSKFYLTPPSRNHSSQIQTKINMVENYVEDFDFDFGLEKDTVLNVVDYITNNEYENLEILVEEEFTAE